MQRRQVSSSTTSGGATTSRSNPVLNPVPPTQNKAYTPLRRQSTSLYSGDAPPSGPRARYPIPSPTPSLTGPPSISPAPGVGMTPGMPPHQYATPANMYSGVPAGNYGGGAGYFPAPGGGGGSLDLGEGSNGFGGFSQERVVDGIRTAVDRFRRGVEDALRLDRSWSLVWGDAELRNLVLKSTLINFLALLLLSMAPLFFSPLFSTSPSRNSSQIMQDRTQQIGLWYNLLLSWPVLAVCFIINASWGPRISKRAQTVLHPSYRHQPSGTSGTSTPTSGARSYNSPAAAFGQVFAGVARVVLISDFTLVSRLLGLVPLLGRILSLGYMCVVNGYYAFEWTFTSKGWPLQSRVTFVQERTAYMLGFGLPLTILSSFGPLLVNTAVFALIYPFFVVQALLARPPVPRSSLLPSTPSPHASLPPSPGGDGSLNLNNPFFNDRPTSSAVGGFRPRVPLFFFASYILEGLRWLEQALLRDRSGPGGLRFGERPGKRLM